MVDVESALRVLITKILDERKCKHTDIEINTVSSEGANYTSALYTIKVTTDGEPLDLFAKVATISGEIREQMDADWIYETERYVYTKLVKVYEALQDEHDVPEEHRFIFPKCYGVASELGSETIVMENLMAKGYHPFNRFESMDWECAAISVELLAKFHALSFAYDKKNPQEFEEITNRMVYKMGDEDKINEAMKDLWARMLDRALNVIDEEHREKVRRVIAQQDIAKKFNKPNGKPVLAHGDYRLSNMLFRHEGKSLDAIVLDYQLLHSGCIATDLIYLIFLGSDEEFRRQYYERLLDHYYEHLCQALRRLNVDPVEVCPRETFDAQMRETLPYALFLGAFLLPVVTVEVESAPNLAEEKDFQSLAMPANDLFASRFRGVVSDCIRWGVI